MNARMGMKMKTDLIQGAIFDMDGTLLDSMPVWEHASERYLQNKGIKVREKLSEILFSMSMQKGAEYVKENYHLTESTDEIVAGVNNIVYTAYEKEVQAAGRRNKNGCGNIDRPPYGGGSIKAHRSAFLF